MKCIFLITQESPYAAFTLQWQEITNGSLCLLSYNPRLFSKLCCTALTVELLNYISLFLLNVSGQT